MLRDVKSAVSGDLHRLAGHSGLFYAGWQSQAAAEFFDLFYMGAFKKYQGVSGDLRDLSGMLDDLATQLEEKIVQCKRLEENARSWFASQPRPEDGSPPIWERQWWRYRPGRFPARGAAEWFTVGTYLRRLGVPI
jgi:hypothetical protein